MKFFKWVLSGAAAFGMVSTASAALIQIDFTGSVIYSLDENGSPVANVAAGDVASGQLVFDDVWLSSLLSGSGDYYAQFQDPSRQTDWITGSISVNGQTYRVGTLPDLGAPTFEDDYVQLTAQPDTDVTDPYYFVGVQDARNQYLYEDGTEWNAVEALGIYGRSYEDGSLDALDLSDLAQIQQVLSDAGGIYFTQSLFGYSYSTYSWVMAESLHFAADITSVSIARLDSPASVPEPASALLLLAGLVGVGMARRQRKL